MGSNIKFTYGYLRVKYKYKHGVLIYEQNKYYYDLPQKDSILALQISCN